MRQNKILFHKKLNLNDFVNPYDTGKQCKPVRVTVAQHLAQQCQKEPAWFLRKHLPHKLREFCYCFNHRFDLSTTLMRLGKTATQTLSMTHRLRKLAGAH